MKAFNIIEGIIKKCDAEEWDLDSVGGEIVNLSLSLTDGRNRWARAPIASLEAEFEKLKALIQKGKARDAAEFGIIIGLRYAAIVSKLERPRGGGGISYNEDFWSYVRQQEKLDHRRTVAKKIAAAVVEFKKDHSGREPRTNLDYVSKHYKKRVKSHTDGSCGT